MIVFGRKQKNILKSSNFMYMEVVNMTEGKENDNKSTEKEKVIVEKVDQSCQFDGFASGTKSLV